MLSSLCFRSLSLSSSRRSLATVTKGTSSIHPGASVCITSSGETGVISEYLKGGWWSVDVNNVVKKVRAKDLRALETPISTSNQQEGTILADRPSYMPTPADSSSQYRLHFTDAPPLHASFMNWVLFSDLHVKSASIAVCEEVLRNVHEAAVIRKAGVIFLGDFWHVRGALSVDLLNRVLSELSRWTQPVIMIPGDIAVKYIHTFDPLRESRPGDARRGYPCPRAPTLRLPL